MRIHFQTRGIDLSPSRRARLSRRVHAILGRLGRLAESVSLYVGDDDGGAGNRRTLCEVTIALPRIRVMARHRGAGVVTTVFFAVKKACRRLDRYLRRRATLRLAVALQPALMRQQAA